MAEIADELRARLRDEWLRKATSSFTCQECGIQANFIDEIIAALDAKDKRIAELEAALEPFAEEAEHIPDHYPNDRSRLSFIGRGATVGDFRRAFALSASRIPNKEDRNG